MNTLNSSTNLNSVGWCAYRLPCGICEKLKEQCPKQVSVNYCNTPEENTVNTDINRLASTYKPE